MRAQTVSSGNIFYRIHPEGSPNAWIDCGYSRQDYRNLTQFQIGLTYATGGVLDIAEVGWRKI
jgi:hypothetical protein